MQSFFLLSSPTQGNGSAPRASSAAGCLRRALALSGAALASVALGCGGDSDDVCEAGAEECQTTARPVTGDPGIEATTEAENTPEAEATPEPTPVVEPEGAPDATLEPTAAAEPAAGAALYLVGARVFDDTTTTSYFHVLPSLDAGVSVDMQRALEVSGSATLYSAPDFDWFAIGAGEEPTITRYTLDDAGSLVAGQSMSLLSLGVADLWDTLYFVSETKAYYPDREGGQLVIFNPSTMEISGTVDLPDTLRDGYLALYGYLPIWRGTELLISVGWFDWDVNDTVLPETGVVVLDTTTDTVVRFDVDTRCGGVTHPVTLPSGETYLVSSALAGAANRLGRLDTAPCALRIPAGTNQLDAEYSLSLETVTGSPLVGEPVPAGSSVFLRAFDDTLATVEGPTLTYELTGQAAWRWLEWDPITNEAVPSADIPPSTADVTWFQVDGRVYGSETTPDYSETTLIQLSADAPPLRSLTVPGFVYGAARIR